MRCALATILLHAAVHFCTCTFIFSNGWVLLHLYQYQWLTWYTRLAHNVHVHSTQCVLLFSIQCAKRTFQRDPWQLQPKVYNLEVNALYAQYAPILYTVHCVDEHAFPMLFCVHCTHIVHALSMNEQHELRWINVRTLCLVALSSSALAQNWLLLFCFILTFSASL